ncbi:single-stranded DNA-binding protein [Fonticella tunisiensis]|uniref:Single-stranded DNA-binding protein n=1 Tax=Fonticella tunisiensis TaxID=1096341 RepID=A0A4R7KM59_9CLOT|nr:single-stranded DNA-binding protein [Fonticella tunisiensis]TDT56483.1 single-strand DNA-binding protein [Fonticella tunisiensis]
MNKVVLIGRLVKDAEVKNVGDDGKSVLNFTMAVQRDYINSKSERESDFIPIVYWHKSAEKLKQYLTKGRMISVSGRIRVRSFEGREGGKKYVTEILADEIKFLSSRKDGGAAEQ